ncbi:MAG: type II secretion system protein GspE [Syntrophus sp. (in: bacteria)]|nr:type II secretion system protein GspE [Syntrophus sp. (in: bacteria)]
MVRRRLGEILVEAGRISQEELNKALAEQKKYGEKLGKVIVKIGLLSEKEIMDTISKQLGIHIVTLDGREIPAELIALIPEDMEKNYMVLPIERRFNVLKLAMVDPLDLNAIDEVTRLVRMEVEPYIVTEGEMKRALEKYLGMKTLVEETLERMKETRDIALVSEEDKDQQENVTVSMTEEEPVVRFVNSLLAQALTDNVSDIHIEPYERRMRVRMRIDGKLREVPSPEKKMFLPIISRIKIIGGMDIAKTRMPQDGRFDMRDGSKVVSVRVSTFPTIYGEKAVLRLLDKSAALSGVDKLGLLTEDEEKVRDVLKRPYGFILSTGPTGSGKSTTLYAFLNYLNSVEKNIITVEDPVEYTLEGIAQAQVNARAGLTFESGLRSILRQDPDIIMVGEIRDKETATIAIHSALTGHLVLSTLHTNDAPSAVTRLVEMGIETFLVSSSVSCVIGQRLLRRICNECKEPYTPSRLVLESMGIKDDVVLYKGRGCPACRGSGYKGRTGIYEVLVMDDDIRELVYAKASSDAVRKRAVEKGMTLMKDDAVRKAIMGITTIEEAINTALVD